MPAYMVPEAPNSRVMCPQNAWPMGQSASPGSPRPAVDELGIFARRPFRGVSANLSTTHLPVA